MSLISTRNIISPFTNKLHLVTILVLSLSFGIFRLMGGTVKSVPSTSLKSKMAATAAAQPVIDMERPHAAVLDEELDDTDPFSILGQESRPSQPRVAEGRSAAQGKTYDGAPAQKAPSTGAARSKSSGLDDIERSLGMR